MGHRWVGEWVALVRELKGRKLTRTTIAFVTCSVVEVKTCADAISRLPVSHYEAHERQIAGGMPIHV
jgi:hypothetical protein